jgi:hypothetical protein
MGSVVSRSGLAEMSQRAPSEAQRGKQKPFPAPGRKCKTTRGASISVCSAMLRKEGDKWSSLGEER